MRDIKISYRACDGAGRTRSYKTLAGAQSYAHQMVGETPEIGSNYAVSGDGVGRVRVKGATLMELFPACFPAVVVPADEPEELAGADDTTDPWAAAGLPWSDAPLPVSVLYTTQLDLFGN